MIECDDKQCRIAGAITVDSTGELLRVLKPRIAGKIAELDFSRVESVDSTILALLLSCKREARLQGYPLRLSGLPGSVTTLADLYGISSLLQA